MPRDPKPWFRKDRDAWFVTINGRRFNLGPDRDTAHKRFHELMLTGGEDRPVGPISVFRLFDQFLEWSKAQRAPQTYGERYLGNKSPSKKEVHDLDNEKTGTNECQI